MYSYSLALSLQNDPNSVELCYYKDTSKKEKKHVINLSSILGIRPTPKIGSADNIFAIETKDKKYILKAADVNVKNIWLAKLCEYCGQGKKSSEMGPGGGKVFIFEGRCVGKFTNNLSHGLSS